MLNSRLDFHEWKFAPNHWLPTRGRVLNACVEGFGNHGKLLAWRLVWEANHACVWDVQD